MTKPSVVFVTNARYRGGTQDHVVQVADGLVRRGFRVGAVVTPREDLRWYAEELEAVGVDVRVLEERGTGPLGSLKRVWSMREALRPYAGGILHLQFNGHPSGELTMIAARLAGIRHVVRTDHNPPLPVLSRFERNSLRVRDRFLDKVIVICEQDRRLYRERMRRDPRKMVVVPHGVDTDLYSRRESAGLRETLGIRPDERVIGNVANVDESKGTDKFVAMAALLKDCHPDWRFLVVGSGGGLSRFQAQAQAAGLGDRIIFTGHVPKDTVPGYLSIMDVFVLPSIVESGPYTLLEAMATGLPVVATEVGFVNEVVERGVSGLVVPPGDPTALADSVVAVLSDTVRAEQMGANGRKKVVEQLGTEAMVGRVVEIYRNIGVATAASA